MAGTLLTTGTPSGTALRVATVRAAHRLLDDPIVFDDPLALAILGPETEAAMRADPYRYNDQISRGLRASLIVRSRVAEDELARAAAAGVRQYVVLGAGLDTFAYRNSVAGLRVFEIDHPATQAWKRECLVQAGIAVPDSLTFAPVDFEEGGTLADGLAAAGFDRAAPACFSWLGVTMYLGEETVFDTLAWIAGSAPGSSVVFDFRVPLEQLNPVERAVTEMIMQRVAEAGEPWVSAFDPEVLRVRLLEIGFQRAEALLPDALNRRYLFQRKDGLSTRVRLMCAWR
jgi:methyltransferase (TIGR00027 family)